MGRLLVAAIITIIAATISATTSASSNELLQSSLTVYLGYEVDRPRLILDVKRNSATKEPEWQLKVQKDNATLYSYKGLPMARTRAQQTLLSEAFESLPAESTYPPAPHPAIIYVITFGHRKCTITHEQLMQTHRSFIPAIKSMIRLVSPAARKAMVQTTKSLDNYSQIRHYRTFIVLMVEPI